MWNARCGTWSLGPKSHFVLCRFDEDCLSNEVRKIACVKFRIQFSHFFPYHVGVFRENCRQKLGLKGRTCIIIFFRNNSWKNSESHWKYFCIHSVAVGMPLKTWFLCFVFSFLKFFYFEPVLHMHLPIFSQVMGNEKVRKKCFFFHETKYLINKLCIKVPQAWKICKCPNKRKMQASKGHFFWKIFAQKMPPFGFISAFFGAVGEKTSKINFAKLKSNLTSFSVFGKKSCVG